ncbi:MAG: UDP-N-acetylmuramate dehydrogenase [Anaerolineales bacterium]|nr:UDP-N-acetylmuramate dehydrogenase [Anaerolineales bacterium]
MVVVDRLMTESLSPAALASLERRFGAQVRFGIPLARYTAARVGGPAECLIEIESAAALADAAAWLWAQGLDFLVLGGGSNVLVSDSGLKGVILVNKARAAGKVRFEARSRPPVVWAEAGVNLGVIARQAAVRGLSGLEWAAGIPGTLGGAVVGNAGAHGGDIAANLIVAEILQREQSAVGISTSISQWSPERMEFAYRSSRLKKAPGQALVLSATLRLESSSREAVEEKMEAFNAYRRQTQPPGASMGSMFKNPPSDYAGRLIEAAGLKGARVGGAQISLLHANFFVNEGAATAGDIYALIQLARRQVRQVSGVELETEIQLLGDFA